MPKTIPEILVETRERLGINKSEMARKMGVSSQLYGRYESGEIKPKADFVNKFETLFSIDLMNPDNLTEAEKIRSKKAFGTGEEENWPLFVPVAAQAGYAAHVYDPVYMDQLQPYPMLGTPYKGDKYRVFEVEGDSMTIYNETTGEIKGLREGFYIVAQKVEKEDWHQTVQWYVHVIVLQDAVFIKRLYRDKDKDGDDSFVLISDNTSYQQRRVKMKDVKELWILKKFISWDVPPPKMFEITV